MKSLQINSEHEIYGPDCNKNDSIDRLTNRFCIFERTVKPLYCNNLKVDLQINPTGVMGTDEMKMRLRINRFNLQLHF